MLEAAETIGGGCRSAELTLPGFVHDVCSAFHPWPLASPFLRTLPLEQHGLELIQPPAPLAHPFDDGTAAVLERSVEATAASLGADEGAYWELFRPLTAKVDDLMGDLLGPVRPPRHPISAGRFGLRALRSAAGLARSAFSGERARALFGGMAAHAMVPLDQSPTAAYGLMLGTVGHAHGWPVARGGSQTVADSLASYLRSLGGEVETGRRVESLDGLPPARAILFDVTPRQLLTIARDRLPSRYRRRLERFRYGPGVFKVDWAIEGSIPWRAQECLRAGTVHLAGTLDEIVSCLGTVARGDLPEKPYVLLGQQSLFDRTRAPDGKNTVWAYCHVPNGAEFDMTERIERQVERFAPGFGERVLARRAKSPLDLERYNANYVGGDINGGLQDLRSFLARPVTRLDPYATPAKELFLCSSSTPPGGGVHGMCGYFAARAALRAL